MAFRRKKTVKQLSHWIASPRLYGGLALLTVVALAATAWAATGPPLINPAPFGWTLAVAFLATGLAFPALRRGRLGFDIAGRPLGCRLSSGETLWFSPARPDFDERRLAVIAGIAGMAASRPVTRDGALEQCLMLAPARLHGQVRAMFG